MPQFYFHLRDQHYLHEDCTGTNLPDVPAALEEALRVGRELTVSAVSACGLEYEITDDDGRTVLIVPVQAQSSCTRPSRLRANSWDQYGQPRADPKQRLH